MSMIPYTDKLGQSLHVGDKFVNNLGDIGHIRLGEFEHHSFTEDGDEDIEYIFGLYLEFDDGDILNFSYIDTSNFISRVDY